MWLREGSRAALHARDASLSSKALLPIKYFGKWPFTRVLGMQVRATQLCHRPWRMRASSCGLNHKPPNFKPWRRPAETSQARTSRASRKMRVDRSQAKP